jgi:hypothetical protein
MHGERRPASPTSDGEEELAGKSYFFSALGTKKTD